MIERLHFWVKCQITLKNILLEGSKNLTYQLNRYSVVSVSLLMLSSLCHACN